MPRRETGAKLKYRQDKKTYYIYHYTGGCRIVRSTGTGCFELAQKKLQEYLGELRAEENKRHPDSNRRILADCIADYVKEVINHSKKSSQEGCKRALRNVVTRIGHLTVAQATPDVIRRYYDDRHKQGVGTASTRKEIQYLMAALNNDVYEQRLLYAPKYRLPKAPNPRTRVLSMDELQRLYEACGEVGRPWYLRLFFMMAVCTPARKTAILSLTWDKVDFDKRTIDFRQGDETTKKNTKYPMPNNLMPFLQDARNRGINNGAVFHIGNHKPIKDIKKAFATAAKNADIEGIYPHALRRTCATMLIESDSVTEQLRKGWIGHEDERTTQEHYTSIQVEQLRVVAQEVDRLTAPITAPKRITEN